MEEVREGALYPWRQVSLTAIRGSTVWMLVRGDRRGRDRLAAVPFRGIVPRFRE